MDMFSDAQLVRLANILDNLGQVVVASVALPPLLGTSVDTPEAKVLLWLGVLVALFCWWFSLRLDRIAS